MHEFNEQPNGANVVDSTMLVDPIRSRCQLELFDLQRQSTDSIAAEIFRIHYRLFPKLLNNVLSKPEDSLEVKKRKRRVFKLERKFKLKDIIRLMSDPNSTLILCKDTLTGEFIGYSFTVPINLSDSSRSEESKKTAYIFNIGLLKKYSGHGLASQMLSLLEGELVKKGFSYLEGDFRTENSFNQIIERKFGTRIVNQSGPQINNPVFGPQMFYRIRLGE